MNAQFLRPYTLYEQGTYLETVIEENSHGCIVKCTDGEVTRLYRIEWLEDKGTYRRNVPAYTLHDAYQLYFKQAGH